MVKMTKIYHFYHNHLSLSYNRQTKLAIPKLEWRVFFTFVQVTINMKKTQKQSGSWVLSTGRRKYIIYPKCFQTFFLDSNSIFPNPNRLKVFSSNLWFKGLLQPYCALFQPHCTSNGGSRREEKSRKHWSFFTKLFFSVTANLSIY